MNYILSDNIIYSAIYSIIILFCILIFSAYLSFIERRLLAFFQKRHGPNRVGWQGSLQLLADAIKLIFKEDWNPSFADKFLFILAPVLSFSLFLIIFTIIPISPDLLIFDIDLGILFFLMIIGLTVYPILFAGFSSKNKYSLLGAMRASAQTLSYEVFLGLSIMGVVSLSRSFRLIDIINYQHSLWNIIPQFFGFITFFCAGIAICHRHPFDQPESEQELADGYHIEYSGMKFGMFFIGEYIGIVTISAFTVILFLGGWNGPFLYPLIWFIIKTILLIILFILIRASLPRPRYDQVLSIGWKFFLPVTLINLSVTGIIILYQNPHTY